MSLFLDIGQSNQPPQTAVTGNCLVLIPEGRDDGHGVLLACAEGMAERPEPQQAARTVVTALGDHYYAATAGLPLRQALEESLNAAHQSLLTAGERGRAAVLTVLVLRGRRWLMGHAGHIRAWVYRDLQLKQLNHDHLLPRLTRRAEITRAFGLVRELDAEFNAGEIAQDDIYVLTSPAVHEALPGPVIMGVLESDGTAQQMAEALAQRAVAAGAKGYIGVCLARIERLPPETADDAREGVVALPVADPPDVGKTIDGFHIEELVHTSRRFRLYKATDREAERDVVLRFPNPSFYDDPKSVQTFLREEWIGKRIESPYIVKTLALRPGRRSALYSVMEYYEGENLAKRIRRKQGLAPIEALRLGEQLLQALETLHRQGVIHRDVRPNNLIFETQSHELRLLGLGSSRIEALQESGTGVSTSALSYCAPELHTGAPAAESTDLYAAGVTIYRMLTGEYPYGKIRTPEDVGQSDYVALGKYKEGLPSVLDDALRRACAANAMDRYANAAQFSAALLTARALIESAEVAQQQTPEKMLAHWPAWATAGGLIAALGLYLYFTLR